MSTNVLYAREPSLPVADFRRVLVESGLGAIRAVDDAARLQSILDGSNFIVTARRDRPGGELIGVARGMNDGAWACYVADLAVAKVAQGLGVGKGLLDEARRQLGPRVSLILVSVPDAVGFYERAGMTPLPHCFWYKRTA
jgi:GNAT superfamily N-acetyltransferase